MSNRKYTQEHIEYIAANITGRSFKEFTDMFNNRFGKTLRVSAMVSLADRHGLHNGIDAKFNKGHQPTQFRKGMTPWNKGKKGTGGWEPTQFKKGNKPANWVPIGTERVNTDGYVDIKIQDGKFQKNWRPKHLLIWEEHNGPVPKGHVVIFGDGNRRNFEPDNLLLVSRKQLVRLNQYKLIQNDAELTRTGIIMADIYSKIGERKKKFSN
ncbi:MAG: phage protein [Peptococcaceae bacterium BICA1-8]|nr:MAG: phage protein [Peptococcaceae bacterium BICA1-8]